MSIKEGSNLPSANFVRIGANGPEKVSTDSLKGKPAVILFFPLANTGICEKELCEVRDGLEAYNKLSAKVVAISVDQPFAQKLWAEKHNFNFELWSDFNKEGIKAFNCAFDELVHLKGVAKRSAFVSDSNGVVRYAAVSDDPKQIPDFKKIQDVLGKLS